MGNLQATSSSNNTNIKYDVFLSFRGEDTRGGFTSHLYAALRGKQIETFMDDRLIRGDHISSSLSRAIEESKISVVIFSKDYASSKWCLRELVEILKHEKENNQIVIPVFYGVDPSDVRKQTGSFKDSFDKHGKESREEVRTWREALTKASNKSGWHSSVERTEAALVLEIVCDIWEKLKSRYISPGFGALIGIERINQIISLLCLHDRTHVLIIGIWGMGGIGKTTLADAIFHDNSNHFQGVCFIQNVRERLQNSVGLVAMRKEILSRVLNDKTLELGSPTIPQQIKERLQGTRVFIVLDDVDDFSQIEDLVKGVDGLGKGSRILITSRDRHVLQNCRVNDDNIYEVKGFNPHEALQLFLSHAFKDSHPTEDFTVLSKEFLDYAKGNPLALKVLGSSLYRKSKQEWKSAVNTSQTNFDRKISDVLKISFDGLDYREKNIFLDIACFLKGKNREYVAKILDDCYYSLSVLIDKSLITISLDNSIQMHDLLQEMGRKIAHNDSPDEVGKHSRLWRQEDVLNTLKRDDGTSAVQGIVLYMPKIINMRLSPQAFKKMYNLRLLQFKVFIQLGEETEESLMGFDFHSPYHSKVHFGEGLSDLPDKLRSLIWHKYPSPALPSNFNPDNLVELDLRHSNVERLWKDTTSAPKLKWLVLYNCTRLTKISGLSKSPLIEKIDIRYCSSLLDFPPLARHVNNLRDLFMKGCESLRSFPCDYPLLGLLVELDLSGSNVEKLWEGTMHAPKLKWLVLYNCTRLTKISDLSEFPLIEKIDIRYCSSLLDFPQLAQHVNNLRDLFVEGCESLRSFPSDIHFESLSSLDLHGCKNITKFPKIFGNITHLDLSGTAIDEVPPSILCLIKLCELNLSDCTRLQHIPTIILKLNSLDKLYLENCSRLESLPEILDTMECLRTLKLSGTTIKELQENFGDLKSLRYHWAERTAITSSMKHLKNLEKLSRHGCKGLRFTHSLGLSCSLRSLCLSDCNLKEIPEVIFRLSSLLHLDLSKNHFEHLPKSMKQLCNLNSLKLNNCNMLQSLTVLPTSLNLLCASDCKQLRSIPDAFEFAELIKYEGCFTVFIFTNCLKLEAGVGNMLAQLRKYLNKESGILDFCYAGSEVPGWFIYRTEGSSIKFGVPEGHELLGFAVCAVIAFEEYCYVGDYENELDDFGDKDFGDTLEVSYSFKSNYKLQDIGDIMVACKNKTLIGSDHVVLRLLPYSLIDEFTDCSFKFWLSKKIPNCRVKNCGVCPIYAKQNIGETSGRSCTSNDHQEKELEPHSKRLKHNRSLSL